MPKKTEQEERRRFEDAERKPWTKEEREAYEKRRDALRPYIRDLTTPAPKKKEKGILDDLLPVVE